MHPEGSSPTAEKVFETGGKQTRETNSKQNIGLK